MASRYSFSEEEIEEIKEARRKNKNKRVEARLKALELRAAGMKSKAVSEAVGFHPVYITKLVRKYREGGLEAITGNHYRGNRRNMSVEAEAAILEPFFQASKEGHVVDVSEIESAYRQAVGHSIGSGQIYCVLRRHDWRKVMPRSKHPKKASEEVIEASKKLTKKWEN